MALFCTNCGASLEEGQICACKQVATQQPQYSQPIATAASASTTAPASTAAPASTVAPATPNAAITYLKGIWSLALKLLKAPATVGTQFTSTYNFKAALGFMGAQALAVAFLLMSFAGKMNSVINLGGTASASVKFPMVTIFFVSGICTFGIACILPAVLMLFVKIFKGNTDYKYMLCVSGVNSVMLTPFILVGLVVSLIMPLSITSSSFIGPFIYPLVIALCGNALGSFASIKSLKGGTNINDDKSVFVMFLTGIVMAIVLYLVMKIALPMCLPSYLKSGLELTDLLGY